MKDEIEENYNRLVNGDFPERVKAIRYFEKTKEAAPFLAQKLVEAKGPQRGWILPALRKTIDIEILEGLMMESGKNRGGDLWIKTNCLIWELARPSLLAVLDTITNDWSNYAINFSCMLLGKAGLDSYLTLSVLLDEDKDNKYYPPEDGYEEDIDREIVAMLATTLEKMNWQNWVKGLWFSGMSGKTDFRYIVPAFIEALKDDSLHDIASWALGNSGGWSVEILKQNLGNSDERIRSGAEKALVRLPPGIIPEMKKMLEGAD